MLRSVPRTAQPANVRSSRSYACSPWEPRSTVSIGTL